jgi:hypothetical protein
MLNRVMMFSKIYDDFFVLVWGFSFIFWGVFMLKVIFSLGGYYIPDNLENLSKVESQIFEDYKLGPEDFNISYMNDSYIFIEYTKLSQKKVDSLKENNLRVPYEVIILKTDVLFE